MSLFAGRYKLDRRLGQGGMGEVWAATDIRLDRQVAIKLVKQDFCLNEESIRRFVQESTIMACLDHPGIPSVFEAARAEGDGELADRLYLAMQFIDGYDIGQLIEGLGQVPIGWAAFIAAQACAVLKYAHGRGIVHRDLKPGNLMLSKDGTVKVLDFGLAIVLDAELTRITRTGAMQPGTAAYMSPEQAEYERTSPQSDLYSLGCVLYKMICGDQVFPGRSELGMLVAHKEVIPPPLRARRAEVPASLEELVAQLLAKRPEDRPRSAEEVYDRLVPFVHGLGSLAPYLEQTPTSSQQYGALLGRAIRQTAESAGDGMAVTEMHTLSSSISLADLARAGRQAGRLARELDYQRALSILVRAVGEGCLSFGADHPEVVKVRLMLTDTFVASVQAESK